MLSFWMVMAEIMGALHLVGLSLAFGSALVGDFLAFRSFLRPGLDFPKELLVLNKLNKVVTKGLVILCLTGLWVVVTGYHHPSQVPQTIWVKIFLVCMLFGNTFVLQRSVLLSFHKLARKANSKAVIWVTSPKIRLKFAFFSSVSSIGWLGAFSLGYFSRFEALNAVQIMPMILLGWAAVFLITLMAFDILAMVYQKRGKSKLTWSEK